MSTIVTQRLLLRPPREADIEEYVPFRAHPQVMRYLAQPEGEETSEDVAARIFRLFMNAWAEHGFGPWLAFDRVTRALLGQIGPRHVDDFDETELLWSLHPDSQGHGLATEGAMAARDYSFERLGLATIFAQCDPENTASSKVMAKIGMRREPDRMWHGHTVTTWRLDRGDWRPAELASYRRID